MDLHIVGAKGAAARLIVAGADAAAAQAQEGEVCVPVEGFGAWIISADGTSAALAAPNESEQWMEIRRQRDALLADSDKTQLADIPEATRLLWQPYRQALRDIPETFATPDAVVWPERP